MRDTRNRTKFGPKRFYGRSEEVQGKPMWAIYRGKGSFEKENFVAYFEKQEEAVQYIIFRQECLRHKPAEVSIV